jgi:heptose I phosphotransferase
MPVPCHVVYCLPDWPRFAGADWLDRIMAVPTPDRFHAKQGRSIGRWTLTSDAGETLVVYLKRHFELPWRHGRLAQLFPGRAWSPGLQEWEHLRWAEREGLPVPRAWAAGELRGPGDKLQSFLAVEELAGMLPLHEAIPLASERLDAAMFGGWKRGLIAECARLTRELHRRRAFHKDLYLCHFYIAEADTRVPPTSWSGRVVVIDFHRLARHRFGWQWYAVKDLAQWVYSADVPGMTAADNDHFWAEYRSGDWGNVSHPPEWVWRAAGWKASRYRRHHERRVT